MKFKFFYNFKMKRFIVKPLSFNQYEKSEWNSIEEKVSNKDDCHYLGEIDYIACQKFVTYVRDKVRIGVRDEPYPELDVVLIYYYEWGKDYFGQ